MTELAEQVLAGDRRGVARLITLVENGSPGAAAALARLHPQTGRAHVVGITGAPGTGKSTLVNRLALALRADGVTVGIIAVDPTSPFSGGAILGDRIRMQELSGDPGVFIRSMATRGALGGLARATGSVIKVLDAFGKDVILVETVGVGQDEVDIARAAHTTVVVEAPGMGDDIQAIKAGVLEIADILVVNKADREGVERTVAALEMMLDLGGRSSGDWRPPIIRTIAPQGAGVPELLDAIRRHRQHLIDSGGLRAREMQRVRRELLEAARDELFARCLAATGSGELEAMVESVACRKMDPATAASSLVKKVAS